MNAEEHEIARKIVRVLDQGTREMDGSTVMQLAAARERALAGLRESPVSVPAWAGQLVSRITQRPAAGLRYVLPMAILMLGLIGIVYWQAGNGSGNELADLDARLLTDDLPIDAYLDKGFDSWLKRQSR
ncbi:MAG: DUF3619 family protein [Betaproteobacteria bacterium]|nr:MAG: DUF3619 family protein [Betaproteobacteria bacterium]